MTTKSEYKQQIRETGATGVEVRWVDELSCYVAEAHFVTREDGDVVKQVARRTTTAEGRGSTKKEALKHLLSSCTVMAKLNHPGGPATTVTEGD